MADVIMLTWFRHRRTSGICRELDIELEEFETARKGVARFAELSVRTVRFLARRRPDVVVVQNPSLVGSLVTLLAARFFGIRTVVDAHNEAVEPFVHRSRTVLVVSRWALRKADLTIVTNEGLAEQVRKHGGRPFVLPDPIPAAVGPAIDTRASESDGATALVIATGAPDEPVSAIVEAARSLPDVKFRITGSKSSIALAVGNDPPSNVVLTGFVDEAEYWELLRTSSVVVDLTLMDDCLVCGAYEAIAVATPLVLSDNAASRQLFGDVARLVANRPDDISAGIRDVLQQIGEYRRRMQLFLPAYLRSWAVSGHELKAQLAALAG